MLTIISVNQTFGQYVRSMRKARGMTQRQLSEIVGFKSLAHLSDIESGKRNPSQETLPKFAEALGIPIDELTSRDMRGALSAAKALFEKRPEMANVFLKIVHAAYGIDAEELLRRVTDKTIKLTKVTTPLPKQVSQEPLEAALQSPELTREHIAAPIALPQEPLSKRAENTEQQTLF